MERRRSGGSESQLATPSTKYRAALSLNSCEGRRLSYRLHDERRAMDEACTKITKLQISQAKRHSDVFGYRLYSKQVITLDAMIYKVTQLSICHSSQTSLSHRSTRTQLQELSATGSLLLPPLTSQTAHGCVDSSSTGKTRGDDHQRLSDLGKQNINGNLQIDRVYSRPYYPWETKHGMYWLKTLWCSISHQRHSGYELHQRHQSSPFTDLVCTEPIPDKGDTSEPELRAEVRDANGKEDRQLSRPASHLSERSSLKTGGLSDIPALLSAYQCQHKVLHTRNKLHRLKKELMDKCCTSKQHAEDSRLSSS